LMYQKQRSNLAMPFIVTATYTRPNASVPFYDRGNEFEQYLETNYRQTGKLLYGSKTVSADGLTFVQEAHWISRAAFLEFLADPRYMTVIADRDSYLNQHGMTMNVDRVFVPAD